MNLRQIEIFYAIMQAGSISQAAKNLNVSQPTLSQSIRVTEDRLGYLLFRRVKGRIIPTNEAVILLEHAENLMNVFQRVNKISSNLKNKSDEELVVGTVPAFSFEVIPQAMIAMTRDYPNLRISMKAIQHAKTQEMLTRKNIDVALVFCPMRHRNVFSVKHIATGHFRLLTSSDSNIDQKFDLREYLTNERYISISESGPLGLKLDTAISDLKIKPNSKISVESYYSAASFVEKGFGNTIVDNFTANAFSHSPMLSYKLNDFPRFNIGVIYSETNPKAEIILAFNEYLQNVVSSSSNE